jgi:hypothetical protein
VSRFDVSPSKEQRFADAIYLIVRAALEAAPDNPADVVELMLVSAVHYSREALKLSRKDACDFVDVRLVAVFEKFAAIEKVEKEMKR